MPVGQQPVAGSSCCPRCRARQSPPLTGLGASWVAQAQCQHAPPNRAVLTHGQQCMRQSAAPSPRHYRDQRHRCIRKPLRQQLRCADNFNERSAAQTIFMVAPPICRQARLASALQPPETDTCSRPRGSAPLHGWPVPEAVELACSCADSNDFHTAQPSTSQFQQRG